MQTGAKECLLAEEDETEVARILTLLEACNILDTPKRKSKVPPGGFRGTITDTLTWPNLGEFSTSSLEQDLTSLLVLPPLHHNYGRFILRVVLWLTTSNFPLSLQMKCKNIPRWLQRHALSVTLRYCLALLRAHPDPDHSV